MTSFLMTRTFCIQRECLLPTPRTHSLRRSKTGIYPYLCTFPGHWVLMKGEMVVK